MNKNVPWLKHFFNLKYVIQQTKTNSAHISQSTHLSLPLSLPRTLLLSYRVKLVASAAVEMLSKKKCWQPTESVSVYESEALKRLKLSLTLLNFAVDCIAAELDFLYIVKHKKSSENIKFSVFIKFYNVLLVKNVLREKTFTLFIIKYLKWLRT